MDKQTELLVKALEPFAETLLDVTIPEWMVPHIMNAKAVLRDIRKVN